MLKNKLVSVQFRDVRDDPLDHEIVRRFLALFGEALINRRSATWRNINEEARNGDPVDLLLAHPTLMKRPVIEADGKLFVGWGKDVQNSLLG